MQSVAMHPPLRSTVVNEPRFSRSPPKCVDSSKSRDPRKGILRHSVIRCLYQNISKDSRTCYRTAQNDGLIFLFCLI